MFPVILRTAAVLLASLLLAGCQDARFPRDPDGTLDRVLRTGVVRVAAVDNVPWVIVDDDGEPAGAEAELVRAFAADLGVRVDWLRAPAFEALDALERRDVDLAVGGFTKAAVTMHKGASHTFPYVKTSLVVAAAPGVERPDGLDGRTVAVGPQLMAAGLVEAEGGRPVADTGAVPLVALPDWRAPARGLVPTGIVLRRDQHVLALPQGENAWMLRVEDFLRRQAGDMGARLRRHDARSGPRSGPP